MPIPSSVFILLFMPVCILLYFALSFSRLAQNILLFLASLTFYAFGQTTYFLVLLFYILWNYAMGLALGAQKKRGQSGKAIMVLAVGVNLLVWVAFQLANQVLASFLPNLGQTTMSVKLIAPLGLAWFTLQAIGYSLDAYRGEIPPEKNPLYLGLYLSFFPKITMGPLVEYAQMREQMVSRTHSFERICEGLCRFVAGLAKKLFLADQLSHIVNYLFTQAFIDNTITQLPVSLAWLGILAFGLQLYYELSGFTDMAIGLAGIFGFDLPENYRLPFTATSITDFWRRWNITALAWFRKYVFSALPKKQSADLLLRDLLITWVLFALWVGGLKVTALIWGVWNFILLVAEHFLVYIQGSFSNIVKRLYTLLAIALGLVLLRSPSLFNAGQYYGCLFGFQYNGLWSDMVPVFLREYWLPIVAGVFFAGSAPQKLAAAIRRSDKHKPLKTAVYALYPLSMVCLLVLCIAFILRDLAITTPVF